MISIILSILVAAIVEVQYFIIMVMLLVFILMVLHYRSIHYHLQPELHQKYLTI